MATLVVIINTADEHLQSLPFGGIGVGAIDLPGGELDELGELFGEEEAAQPETSLLAPIMVEDVFDVLLLLASSLAGTVVLMVPITWVYMAAKREEGYNKRFVEALIILPICATSIVLLIQDSLALAFGLAALVAAVRFRVRLRDALDGIYIFAAICVGLASGVGYLGVALIMTIFFCYAVVVLWALDYGANPTTGGGLESDQNKTDSRQS